ncbi:MAG: hypothetical protein RLZZ28_1626 [Bacteroidota bacterium]
MKKKLVIIGPAWPLRGGLASFDERLARQFMQEGFETEIYTFSLQYPGFIFPGTTQYSSEPAPEGLSIKACINSINPFNWVKVGKELKKIRPDIIVVRFWLPLMGPCLGSILRRVKKNGFTKVVCIADNIVPHESRPGDTIFTRYFVKAVDAFITMSEKVTQDLQKISSKPVQKLVHPLYDNFGEPIAKEKARKQLAIPEDIPVILFFGFIRKYKGLDLLLKAMNDPRIRDSPIHLLIAGEFYEKREEFDTLVKELNLGSKLILHTDFIPDSEVRIYLSAADFVIQPYRNATQSGVTPLAYHFEKPMLVTNVGGLPDLVPDGKVGVVTEPDPFAIANGILKLYELGESYFLSGLREEKKKYDWHLLAEAIEKLALQVKA